MSLYTLPFESPVGRLSLAAGDGTLVAIGLPGTARRPGPEAPGHPVLRRAAAQLAEYFAGRRRVFDLPLDPGGTPFQRAVWEELAAIPYGETRSYAELARRLGRPRAVRAVGAANGRNPLPIVVPCHRVIGSDGSLTGYAGGLEVKRWLLRLEGWGEAPTGNPLTLSLSPAGAGERGGRCASGTPVGTCDER